MKLAITAISVCCAVQAADCNRDCLKGFADAYFDAMTRHDPSKLATAPQVKFTENGRTFKLGEGLWKTASAVTYKLYAMDPESGGAAVQAVVKENAEAAHLLLRLKVENKKITEVETILARKGQAGFFAPEKLTAPPPAFTQAVPAGERSTREQLASVADSYFTAIQTEGSKDYKPAPLAADADRFENGVQTTNVAILGMPAASASEQLDKAFFKNLTVTDRRYPVLDAEHGVVLGLILMHVPNQDAVLIGEMFKVRGGKICAIQAFMVNHPNGAPTGWNPR